MIHSFTLIAHDGRDLFLEETFADRVFAAGGVDSTLSVRGEDLFIAFDRDSAALYDAILSALSQVESCGVVVDEIQLDDGQNSEVDNMNAMLKVRKLIQSDERPAKFWQTLKHKEAMAQ
ncbi:hypothetical protein [Lacunimicrobium album]